MRGFRWLHNCFSSFKSQFSYRTCWLPVLGHAAKIRSQFRLTSTQSYKYKFCNKIWRSQIHFKYQVINTDPLADDPTRRNISNFNDHLKAQTKNETINYRLPSLALEQKLIICWKVNQLVLMFKLLQMWNERTDQWLRIGRLPEITHDLFLFRLMT